MKKCKKILIISIIMLVASIILGNVFNAISFEFGKYIAMALLYISIGTGALSLIGYFVTKKNDDEKVPSWIIIIIGIIIAIVVANGISKIIEYNQKEKDKYNISQNSQNNPSSPSNQTNQGNQNSLNEITNMAITCASDVSKQLVSFLGEEITEIRYTKYNGETIILIAVKSGTKQTVNAYTGTSYWGSDATANVDESRYTSNTEKETIKIAKKIRELWENSTELDTNKILDKVN